MVAYSKQSTSQIKSNLESSTYKVICQNGDNVWLVVLRRHTCVHYQEDSKAGNGGAPLHGDDAPVHKRREVSRQINIGFYFSV